MMKRVILSIDQGTTGTTSVLIDAQSLHFIDKVTVEYPQIFPAPSWVEHDLLDIWNSVRKSVLMVLEKNKISSASIECIGITNQRETTCAFDNKGIPLRNAIVWQDRRTSSQCEALKKDHEVSIRKKTGLPPDPYFSATKIQWLLNNVEKVKREKHLHFGTIDTFLLYKLTGGESYYTDASNASRTLLMNLKSGTWDNDLLSLFGVPVQALPQIGDSFMNFGETKGVDFLPDGIPITGILGDQQAALLGQAGFLPGEMKCTYGTGAFILFNTGDEIKESSRGLLSTVAYRYQGKMCYALEGSSYIAGAAVQWLRDNLKIINKSSDIEPLALQVENLSDMKDIFFFPFFSGMGSPYWKSQAKASIVGMTRDTSPPHLARACLEGVAFSINDLIEAIKESGMTLKSLKVDGGAVSNNLLMQIQATISDLEIIRPKVVETTAYGAALAASIGLGHSNFESVKSFWEKEKIFSPIKKDQPFYDKKKEDWKRLIQKIYL